MTQTLQICEFDACDGEICTDSDVGRASSWEAVEEAVLAGEPAAAREWTFCIAN